MHFRSVLFGVFPDEFEVFYGLLMSESPQAEKGIDPIAAMSGNGNDNWTNTSCV